MSGQSLIKNIKKDLRLETKILVITGEVHYDIGDLEVNGMINKPFDEKKVYEVLKSLLNFRQNSPEV